MSFEPFPKNLETQIDAFARDEHVSHDEAVRMLVERGLESVASPPPITDRELAAVVQESLKDLESIQKDRQERLAKMSKYSPEAVSLIGILKDEPEAVEAIRRAAHERRRNMYGT